MNEFLNNLIEHSKKHGESLAFLLVLLISFVFFGCGFLLKEIDDRKVDFSDIYERRISIAQEKLDIEHERSLLNKEKLDEYVKNLIKSIDEAEKSIRDDAHAEQKKIQLEVDELIAKTNRENKEIFLTIRSNIDRELQNARHVNTEIASILDEIQKHLENIEKSLTTSPTRAKDNEKYITELILARIKLNLYLKDYRSPPEITRLVELKPIEPMELQFRDIDFTRLSMLSKSSAPAIMESVKQGLVISDNKITTSNQNWWIFIMFGIVFLLFSAMLGHNIMRM